jgi:hypothetical protein
MQPPRLPRKEADAKKEGCIRAVSGGGGQPALPRPRPLAFPAVPTPSPATPAPRPALPTTCPHHLPSPPQLRPRPEGPRLLHRAPGGDRAGAQGVRAGGGDQAGGFPLCVHRSAGRKRGALGRQPADVARQPSGGHGAARVLLPACCNPAAATSRCCCPNDWALSCPCCATLLARLPLPLSLPPGGLRPRQAGPDQVPRLLHPQVHLRLRLGRQGVQAQR